MDLELTLEFINTQHREILGDWTGFGFKLVLYQSGTPMCTIGITSDTGYKEELSTKFDGVNLLIAHIGTLEPLEIHQLLSSHLGYRGVYWLINNFSKKPHLILISEWGEELSGMRKDICDSLQNNFPDTNILPTDFSMRILLPNCDIYIEEEKDYAPMNRVYVHNDFGPRLIFKRKSLM